MPALSFSELGNSKVLPHDKVTSTGGNSADYESKQVGGKKRKQSNKSVSKKAKKAKKAKRTQSKKTSSVRKTLLSRLKFW
jgi:hypothetical protein